MAKIVNLFPPQGDKDKDFYDLYIKLDDEMKQAVDMLKIKSLDEFVALSSMLGIDLFDDEESGGEVLGQDGTLLDDFAAMEEMYAPEEMDPFSLPKVFFIGDPVAEYHIRIKLCDSPVPVWREVKLPSNVSLEFLSFIINDAMGWNGGHLHDFKKNGVIYKNSASILQDRIMDTRFSCASNAEDTNEYALCDLLKKKGDRIRYEYDFGDCWMHEIWVKEIRDYGENESPGLIMVKGSGACPPEDCGGVSGYANILSILGKKRKSAYDKSLLEWCSIDKNYDPAEFDIDLAADTLYALWEEAISQ